MKNKENKFDQELKNIVFLEVEPDTSREGLFPSIDFINDRGWVISIIINRSFTDAPGTHHAFAKKLAKAYNMHDKLSEILRLIELSITDELQILPNSITHTEIKRLIEEANQ